MPEPSTDAPLYDTADARLRAWGCRLSRDGGRWTVALPNGETVRVNSQGEQPPREVVAALRPLTEGATLWRFEPAATQDGDGPSAMHPEPTNRLVRPTLHPLPTTREVIQNALVDSVEQLIQNLPHVGFDPDGRGVAGARTALRRLRSDLGTFGVLLEQRWVDEVISRIEPLVAELDRVHHGGTLLTRFGKLRQAHPELDGPGYAEVVAAVNQRRSFDYIALLELLNGTTADDMLRLLVRGANDPRTAPQADDPADERVGRLVEQLWKDVAKHLKRAGDNTEAVDLRVLANAAEQARYGAEALLPVYGKSMEKAARSAAKLHRLVDHLDEMFEAERWLEDLGDRTHGQTAFAAGRLAQVLSTERRSLENDWEDQRNRLGASAKRSIDLAAAERLAPTGGSPIVVGRRQ